MVPVRSAARSTADTSSFAAFRRPRRHFVEIAGLFHQGRSDNLDPGGRLGGDLLRGGGQLIGLFAQSLGNFVGLGNDLGRVGRGGFLQLLGFRGLITQRFKRCSSFSF